MIYKWFSAEALETRLNKVLDFVSADALFAGYAFVNALFEALQDRKAPDSSTQDVKGHDHAPVASWSGYGGRPVSRGTMYSGGAPGQQWMDCNLAAAAVWTRADNTFAVARPTAMFQVPVSVGFQSAGSPAATPHLVAWVYVKYPAGLTHLPSLDARMVNLTHGGNSAVTAISAGTNTLEGWYMIDQIPALGGQFNNLNLELRSNIGAPPAAWTVSVQGLVVIESWSTMVVASGGAVKLSP